MVGWQMNDNLERISKEAVVTWSSSYQGIFLDGVRIDGAPGKIRIQYFPNPTRNRYVYTTLLVGMKQSVLLLLNSTCVCTCIVLSLHIMA
jgi:hypothetical protein